MSFQAYLDSIESQTDKTPNEFIALANIIYLVVLYPVLLGTSVYLLDKLRDVIFK